MLKRVFGFAAATALAQAWAKKSPKWLSLAGALVLFQFLDSRAARKPVSYTHLGVGELFEGQFNVHAECVLAPGALG